MRAVSQANRGQVLEYMLQLSNDQYRARGMALVHKVPTAWVPLRDRFGKVVNAKVETKAAVDFLGVSGQGVPLAFDAKETADDRWPLRHIENHQAYFLEQWHACGGAAFIVVRFWRRDRTYLVPWPELGDRLNKWKEGGAASISLDDLRQTRPSIITTARAVLDYLVQVDVNEWRR